MLGNRSYRMADVLSIMIIRKAHVLTEASMSSLKNGVSMEFSRTAILRDSGSSLDLLCGAGLVLRRRMNPSSRLDTHSEIQRACFERLSCVPVMVEHCPPGHI